MLFVSEIVSNVSKVECVGITRVRVKASQEPVCTVRGAKEIEKASNNCLPYAVLTSSANVQAPGKGVNDTGLKSSKQMRGDINKSYLECGSLDAVLIEST